jgi:hypothetical protein
VLLELDAALPLVAADEAIVEAPVEPVAAEVAVPVAPEVTPPVPLVTTWSPGVL